MGVASTKRYYRTPAIALLTAVIALAVTRCGGGGDGTGPPPPDTTPAAITVVSGDGQRGPIGTTLPSPLRVRVTNAAGSGLGDVTVNFGVVSGSATLSAPNATTTASGNAETSVTLGNVGEAIAVRASVSGVSAPADFTVVALAPTTIDVSAGDGLKAATGSALPAALEVLVRDQETNPLGGVEVFWTITESAGPGAMLASATSVTNPGGIAANALTLGDTDGTYEVTVSFAGLTNLPAVFTATAVLPATIGSISPSPVREGSAATLTGSNFDPVAANNVVTFDGVTATVTSASATSLDIIVPETTCLPARDDAEFVVAVENIAGPSFFHAAIPGDPSVSMLAVGGADIRADAASVECVQFPAQGGASSFLVIPAVTTGTSGVIASERITRTVGSSTIFGTGGFDIVSRSLASPPTQARARWRLQTPRLAYEFESRLRAHGRDLIIAHGASARAEFGSRAMSRNFATASAAVMEGDTIPLQVLTSTSVCGPFTTIGAVVKRVGMFGIAVEDTAAPPGGFTAADYDAIVAEFDALTYPTDTLYFGGPSDIDSNGKVLLVFTAEINKQAPPMSNVFIAGFFNPGDLFPVSVCAASNEAEAVYTLVPDPNGVFGNVRPTDFVRQVVRGVVTHEIQHLINSAHAVFVTGRGQEELWLNEGLSQLAEEVVGHAVTGLVPGSNLDFLTAAADVDAYNAFYIQNFVRLQAYLQDPASQSPIGPDADQATRGAAWIFLRWILDQEATPATEANITRSLVMSTLTGVSNLEAAVAKNLEDLLPEWLLALFADDFVSGVDGRLTIPSWDLRNQYDNLAGTYPLATTALGYQDGTTNFTVVSGSGRYFLVSSAGASPAMSMRFTTQADSPLEPSLLPRTLLMRLP